MEPNFSCQPDIRSLHLHPEVPLMVACPSVDLPLLLVTLWVQGVSMLLSSLDFSNAENYKVAFIRKSSGTESRTGVRLSHFESISLVHASSVPPSHWLPGFHHLDVNVGLFQLFLCFISCSKGWWECGSCPWLHIAFGPDGVVPPASPSEVSGDA